MDNYAGLATDTSTGFKLNFTMAAPNGYEVITPVSTLVAGLIDTESPKLMQKELPSRSWDFLRTTYLRNMIHSYF